MSDLSRHRPRGLAHPRATAYVAGVALGSIVLVALGDRVPTWAIPVWALSLGPLGVLLLVAGALLVWFGFASPLDGLGGLEGDVLVVLVMTLGALLNAALVIRAGRVGTARAAGRTRLSTDRLLGSTLFLFAGAAFVVLCFLDGAILLLARGVDTVEPDAIAVPQQTAAGIALLLALAAAVAGLVLWPVLWRSGRRLVWWAAGDLAVQIVLIVIPVTVATAVTAQR